MQISSILLSLMTCSLVQSAAVPRCDEDLQFYNHCISDASQYLKSLNVRVTPSHTSRITKCYQCFQEAADDGCGALFGADPDNLSDEGRRCYDVGMEKCRMRRGERCRFFVNWRSAGGVGKA
ncbi:uncharacterized protein H6S33_012893 [Morchella sextelata]|uniref:uncharacterized protein n=1 Tax=Morchella sextelata TaxID=1174677 RepID=UPI001D04A5C0|nr:uncharacterized protein H6S33_012893 [Morchella sextelata]KAH0609407.1 hypothetical protein H6S33_012893 [Morchella sextelata]